MEFGELGGAFVEVFVVGFGDSLEKCREITIASKRLFEKSIVVIISTRSP